MRKFFMTVSLLFVMSAWAQPTTQMAPPPRFDGISVALRGGELTAEAAADREQRIAHNPDDLESRVMLLGFYLDGQAVGENEVKRRDHVLWLVGRYPNWSFAGNPYCRVDRTSDRIGYAAVSALWLGHLEKLQNDPMVIRNAAEFFALDEPDRAEALLKQGKALQPAVADWPERLSRHYTMRSEDAPEARKKELQAAALAEAEEAYRLLSNPRQRFYLLGDLAKANLAAGRPERAEELAQLLLTHAASYRTDWNYGNAIHESNAILGRIELQRGNIPAAKERLLASGGTPGSPQLNSFGPNMLLARELLEKGERQVVLQYFELCRRFWEMGKQDLDKWKQTVESGGTPDFGPNLVY